MFEVFYNEGKVLFVGREWLFKDIEMVSNVVLCMNNEYVYLYVFKKGCGESLID